MNDIKISTTSVIPGYEIVEYKRVVFERVVVGVGVITEFFAGFTDVFGGRSGKMESQMDSLYDNLISAIQIKAKAANANGIIGFSIDIDELSGKGTSMLMISGTGTAVVIRKIEDYSSNLAEMETAEIRTWKCTKCGQTNGVEMIFCPNCGEKRHSNWLCKKCNNTNDYRFNYCPYCGEARSEEQEEEENQRITQLNEHNKHDKSFIYAECEKLENATEIYNYVKEKYENEEAGNENITNFLSIMEKTAKFERMYGNGKKSAMMSLKSFFDHDMTVYSVDISKEEILCPKCRTKQSSYNKSCENCNALFISK